MIIISIGYECSIKKTQEKQMKSNLKQSDRIKGEFIKPVTSCVLSVTTKG